jgi:hypothetical protein
MENIVYDKNKITSLVKISYQKKFFFFNMDK